MRFILKTIAFSLVLLVIYNVMLRYFPETQNQYYAQGFWQENKIKAENFYYHPKKYDVVIVGSSMSEGISLNSYMKNTTTLNFIGGAASTGLAIIKQTKVLPKVIIIETNWLDRSIYNQLIDPLTNKSLTQLRSFAPSFLEANQPTNVLCHILKVKKSFIDREKEQGHFPLSLSANFKSQNSPVDTTLIKNTVKLTKEYVAYFEKRGVKVYLMELPVDPKIYNTVRCKAVRSIVNSAFINTPFIPVYSGEDSLKTSDGFHLTPAGRKQYNSFLFAFLKSNIK